MVVDLLQRVRDRDDPERIALISPRAIWTLGALDREVSERARALSETGVEPGQVHVLLAEATADCVLDLLALWRLGITVAPLNPALTPYERDRAVADLSQSRSRAQAILWTSGTSGRPRGVEVSHANLEASARAAAARMALAPSDVWLATLSPAHIGGLALITRALLLSSNLVTWGVFNVDAVSGLMDGVGFPPGYDRSVTHLSLVPTQLLRLLDHRAGSAPPETFRCALIGGAHTPTGLVQRAHADGWPLAMTYGMTEMTSQVATAPPRQVRAKPGTVGRPLEGVEVSIDAGDEILTRGPTQALGYVGPEVPPLADESGWYHTGDLGHMDGDGDLWITGRRIERIVSGGVTVDAIEVEEVLRAHPGVFDACVVGVPDPEWGERVAAIVVPVEGRFDLEEVDEWTRERLARAKTPKRWLLENELPLNANGKVNRQLLRDLARGD